MGDDEFFSNSRARANPLTLDEVASLSKQLLNITFPLYWQYDERSISQRCTRNLPITWEDTRSRLTRCLQALHARE
jgi:ubiquitin-protein ligase E3 C